MKQNKALTCKILFEGPLPMLIVDTISREINQVNAAAVSFWGYPKEVLSTKRISDLIITDIESIISASDCYLFSSILKSDGSITQRHLTSFPLQLSGKDFVCITVSSSTRASKAGMDDIPKSPDFNLLFGKHPFPGIIFNRETHKILLVNEAAAELYGYPHEEFCSKKMEDIRPETGVPNLLAKINSLMPGRYYKTVAQHQTKDKNVLDVEVHTQPYELENQPAAISFIKNITNRITARPESESSKHRFNENTSVENVNKTEANPDSFSTLRSIILSNMSHELRTPLVGILGYSDIIKSEVANSELKQMAEAIHTSGEKLLTDLNMVLNLSAMEVGMTKLLFSETDICEIIAKVINKMRSEAERKNIYIKFHSSYKNLIIKTDKELIHDALYYVIDNAIKFTRSGGVIIDLDFSFENNKSYYKIQVIDTGMGMSDEQQQIIFESFRQISEGTNRIFGGLGIGLTVAKKIVNMFGGDITFTSKLDEGSNFTMLFPSEI